MMRILLTLSYLAALPVLAQGEAQSALDPKGETARQIVEIAWVLFVGGALIFFAVMLLLGIALFGSPNQRALLGKKVLIIGGGIVFPVITLSALLIYAFSSPTAAGKKSPAARIEVIGELWWWRVRYLDDDGNAIVETANEIRIPAGKPVEIYLKSAEVIHSFWVPNLAGKIDLIPGRVNRLRLQADSQGVFRGQCAEYCGAQHAKMAFYVVALGQAEYDAWLRTQMQPASPPADAQLRQGRQLFIDSRCNQCHAIRDEKGGTLGPDLTHVGSRFSLAAGILPNNRGTLASWITNGQTIKPGNRMPSYKRISGEELQALAAYLASLK